MSEIVRIEKELSDLVQRLFPNDERKIEVLGRYSGFHLNPLEKLAPISADLGCTKEAIRQTNKTAVEKLRKSTLAERTKRLDKFLPTFEKTLYLLELISPCSTEDAAITIYNQGLSDRNDIDVKAVIAVADALEIDHELAVVVEGTKQFVVPKSQPDCVTKLLSEIAKNVSHYGAYQLPLCVRFLTADDRSLLNKMSYIKSALESKPDFTWLKRETQVIDGYKMEAGWFLLKNAGRNPVVLRLRRLFSVKSELTESFIGETFDRVVKVRSMENILPAEVICQVGVAKGICKEIEKDGETVYVRNIELDPEKELVKIEYDIWKYLIDHPQSGDSQLMEKFAKKESQRHTIRSKLNFSSVILRVDRGSYESLHD